MVNNSTNINKTNNHLSPKDGLNNWWSTISTKSHLIESLNSDGQQFHTNINKMNNHLSPKESLNCDAQQFH